MKRITAIWLALLMCVGLFGCQSESTDKKKRSSYYYVNESETQIVGVDYDPESTETADRVQAFLDHQVMEVQGRDSYRHIMPDGVGITGVELSEDGILTLTVSAEYASMERSRDFGKGKDWYGLLVRYRGWSLYESTLKMHLLQMMQAMKSV